MLPLVDLPLVDTCIRTTFEENQSQMTYVAYIIPLDWIYHRGLTLFLSWSHGWFTVSLLSLSVTCPSYVNKADVIISWSDTETHLTRHAPPHLWHPSEAGTGSRLLDQFMQRAAQMPLIFEKPQATQRKLKVWGIAPVATWHTSFTQLPCNSIVFTEHETIW